MNAAIEYSVDSCDILPPSTSLSNTICESEIYESRTLLDLMRLVKSAEHYPLAFNRTLYSSLVNIGPAMTEIIDARLHSSIKSTPLALSNLIDVVRKRIGFFPARRVAKLASYEDAWDGDSAKAPSLESASLMTGFISEIKSFPTTPSFFLSREGYFAISWENLKNERIDIEFEDYYCSFRIGRKSSRFAINSILDIQSLLSSIRSKL